MLCCPTSLTPQSAFQEADAGIRVRAPPPEAVIFLNSDPPPDKMTDALASLATGSRAVLAEYRSSRRFRPGWLSASGPVLQRIPDEEVQLTYGEHIKQAVAPTIGNKLHPAPQNAAVIRKSRFPSPGRQLGLRQDRVLGTPPHSLRYDAQI